MRQVVGLVVTGIDAEALTSEDIVGAQQMRDFRIIDNRANLAAREFSGRLIGLFLKQKVSVRTEKRQPAPIPEFLILGFAFGFARF